MKQGGGEGSVTEGFSIKRRGRLCTVSESYPNNRSFRDRPVRPTNEREASRPYLPLSLPLRSGPYES